MDLLKGSKLTKRFGGVIAVDGIDFEVVEGEILGLIGPNGSGKTTLLNLVCGLTPLTSGEITFRGEKISGLPPDKIARKGMAKTFQVVRPFRGMSVIENVSVGALFGRSTSISMREAAAEAERVLDMVGLGEKRRALVTELNLSQHKRLEVARALAMQPTLLLLDEVMAGLNQSELGPLIDTLCGINQSGVTIIVIEHVMKAVMALSHRVMVLHHGRKIAVGTPDEVAKNDLVISAYLGARYAKSVSNPVCRTATSPA